MFKKILFSLFLFLSLFANAQNEKMSFWKKHGFYLQWGYNRETYTKSTLHFKDEGKHDFTVYNAKAHDQPNFSAIWQAPLEISIPQFSARLGMYLDADNKSAIEVNFDHTKYVMTANQTLRVAGTIGGQTFDKDTLVAADKFLSFEHTNGANFLQINYVRQFNLFNIKNRPFVTVIAKAGGGCMIPKTDVTLFGIQRDNVFHIAGFLASAEAGIRLYPLRNLFLEATAKSGYVNYTNVFTVGTGKAHHQFGYLEEIVTLGYQFRF